MRDAASAVLKTAPPVSIVGAYLRGIHIADVVMILTLIYTTLQIYVLVRDKLVRQ
ncbi:hypothetical protein [Caballeronia sp. AZ7_KS35]|uniref:hypothetical protein n=1 Tax=Caballeronia sp. AZ7_KS35 TaxID=2921762 RepID=UPI0032EAED05